MGRLALVGGHSILGVDLARDAWHFHVDVAGARVPLLDVGHAVVLQRHGREQFVPAHRIDHVANVRALLAAGCDRILAVSSVGSLHPDLPVGTFALADDFVALHLGLSAHDDAAGHRIPGFDPSWRTATVRDVWRASAAQPLRDGAVYWQVIGPRFETPAEIRLMATFADVVGMTMASECVVCSDLDVPYASVCVVDNLANGLAATPLTFEEFVAGRDANQRDLLAALDAVLPVLAEASVRA